MFQSVLLPSYPSTFMQIPLYTLPPTHTHTVHMVHRAATALRVTFHPPPELRPHMEILPKHGLVQGESSFSAQLKFKPKPAIFTECSGFFNRGYLEVPVQIEVANQVSTDEWTDRHTDGLTDCMTRHYACCLKHTQVVYFMAVL